MSVKNTVIKTGLVAVAAVSASPVFAAGEPVPAITAAINAAVAASMSNVTVVVLGVIGLAALGFGVGMIVAYLRK